MSKLWLVALYEYKRHVLKASFLFAVLSVPLTIGLMVGLTWLTKTLNTDTNAVGYVDHAGLLAEPVLPPKPGSAPDEPSVPDLVPLLPFQSEEAARQALASGEIQAYYVIAPDYFETNRVELVFFRPPDGAVTRQFWDFMQINRLTDLPPDVARRAVAGSNLIVRWPDDTPGGGREFSQRTFYNQFVPLVAGVAFVFLLFMSAGYLMGTVVEEKGNRTAEVLFTSLSPTQMMGGKVAAVVGVSFTQLVAWIILAVLALLIGGRILGLAAFETLSLELRVIAPMVAVFIPAYVMFAGLMAAVGATFAEIQDTQGTMAIFIVLSIVPVWLAGPIVEHPNGPLAIGFSLFPLTALPTLGLRVAFSKVPLWQFGVSTAILIVCAVGAMWLAGRAFRLGMLRYGQNLNWRELVGRRG